MGIESRQTKQESERWEKNNPEGMRERLKSLMTDRIDILHSMYGSNRDPQEMIIALERFAGSTDYPQDVSVLIEEGKDSWTYTISAKDVKGSGVYDFSYTKEV